MKKPKEAREREVTSDEYKLRLQLETTLLVWVRTSLGLMGFGFVVARFGLFLREAAEVVDLKIAARPGLARVTSFGGTGLMLLGVVVLLIAIWANGREVERLRRGELRLSGRWSLGTWLGLALAALGMAMAVYLALIEL